MTFNTKSSQIARTFVWPFSWTFGLAYSPLKSATPNCSSEITLMSLVAYQFGHVEFRIFDAVFFKKSKQIFNIINSNFEFQIDEWPKTSLKVFRKNKFISVSGCTQNLSNCCSHKYDQSISINFCPTLKRPFYFRPNPRWILTPILPL